MILGDVRSRGDNNRRGTYQKHGCRDLNLTFWSKDSDYIGRGFLVRESNPAIGFVFDIVNKDTFVPEQCTMIPAGNNHRFVQIVLIL